MGTDIDKETILHLAKYFEMLNFDGMNKFVKVISIVPQITACGEMKIESFNF